MEPMKATSNQKARPWTSPECSMWNLNGISILEGKGRGCREARGCRKKKVAALNRAGTGAGQVIGRGVLPVQISFFGF